MKWKSSVQRPSLKYAAKAVTRTVILAVDIPFPLLKAWHEFLTLQNKETDEIVGESQDHPGLLTSTGTSHTSQGIKEITYDYVDLFEYCISGHIFATTDDEQIRAEVNKTLAKIAGMGQTSCTKAKGGSKKEELN